MEVIYGVKFFLSGDVIRPRERSVILLNHRNRLDWNYFWGALAHATSPPAHNLKIVLKSGIRKFPGLGEWVGSGYTGSTQTRIRNWIYGPGWVSLFWLY